jgi:iron complex outermembrane recepter protein
MGTAGIAAAAETAAPASAPASSSAAESTELPDIVVSARRRTETLHDTPIAMTAIAPQQMENKGAVTIGDLQGAAPNVLITQQNSGPSAANLSIRGLTFADIEKSFDPTVAVVVDSRSCAARRAPCSAATRSVA